MLAAHRSPHYARPMLQSVSAKQRADRRLGARSLGPAPSLSVMSYIDLARSDRLPAQRSGIEGRRPAGDARRCCGRTVATLARSAARADLQQGLTIWLSKL